MFFLMLKNNYDGSKCSRLYENHKDAMYRRAFKILRSAKDAEDAVHDSFERVLKYNYLQKIDENNFAHARNILCLICANVSKDFLRKYKKIDVFKKEEELFNIADPGSFNPENVLIDKETKNKIKEIIKSLPEIYKDVFLMNKIYEMSIAQISGITGEKEDTIRKRIKRAQEKIKIAFIKEIKYEK